MIRIAVIVCTYRREESLRNLLRDLSVQDTDPSEIIVVDQTPVHEAATTDLLERLAPLVRVVKQTEPNLPLARNRGALASSSNTLVFVDDDVRLRSDFIRRVASYFGWSHVDGLVPIIRTPIDATGNDAAAQYRLKGDWRKGGLIPVKSAIGACMVIRRRALEVVGGFDPFYGALDPTCSGEDLDFTSRLSGAGFGLYLSPDVEVFHDNGWGGGCDVRTGDSSEAARRAYTYLLLKRTGGLRRIKLRSAMALGRAYMLRRDVLTDLRRLARAPGTVISDLAHIRDAQSRYLRTLPADL